MRSRALRKPPARPTATARRPHVIPVAPRSPELQRERRAEHRARASGGPQDRALYTCSCGLAFQAAVSTSVACPHCGTGQAW